MFFRRQRPKVVTFLERVEILKKAGFRSESRPNGETLITKHGVGALLTDKGQSHPEIQKAGILIGHEICVLLNQGYQMFLESPNGKRYPAQAEQLKALHQFEDDLKDAFELTNLYNTSLGTTSRKHMYDRVTKRDAGMQPKPWEHKDRRIQPPETKDSQPI